MRTIRTEIAINGSCIKKQLRNDVLYGIWVVEGTKISHTIGEEIWNNINFNISHRIHDAMMEKFMLGTLLPEHKFLF